MGIDMYFSYEAVKKTPAKILKNIVELTEYQNELIEKLFFLENKIPYCNSMVYSYDNINTGMKYNLGFTMNNKYRKIRIVADYYFDRKTYVIKIDIYPNDWGWGGGEGFIMLFDYIYEKNPKLLEKVTDLITLTDNDGYKNYKPLYRTGLAFDIKKDKKRVYAFLKDAIEWVFTQEEIIEVLKGNKWLEGYCPPPPY